MRDLYGTGRWKPALLAALVLCAIASAAAAAGTFSAAAREKTPRPLPEVDSRYTDYASAAYILKERGGYVAVFSSNGRQLVEITGIPVSSLRQGDQALLEAGVAAADRQAVLELLEDFGS